MNQRLLLYGIAFMILVLLLAGPALAATVTCPSSCSCTKYCYLKPVTTTTVVPQFIVTGYHVITPTTTVPAFVKCSPDCSCEYEPDGERRHLTLCGGSQYLCGMDHNGVPKYCYVRPPDRPSNATTVITVTPGMLPATTTPTPAAPPSGSPAPIAAIPARPPGINPPLVSVSPSPPVPGSAGALPGGSGSTALIQKAVACPQGCTCLDNATIAERRYPFCGGSPAICGYTNEKGVYYCANITAGSQTIAQKPEPGTILSTITGLIASIFSQTAPRPELSGDTSTMYIDYCRVRYGLTSCDSGCENLSESTFNCGGCENNCAGYSRSMTEICCAGTCADINTDPRNCGECGYTCPAGAPCVEGICSATGCRDPHLTACNDTCTDLRSDQGNCGGCGNACPSGRICEAGTCTDCGGGRIACPTFDGPFDSACTDPLTDRENCGECRHHCSHGKSCIRGVCTGCPPGESWCDERVCKNLEEDEENCGSCGNTCRPGESCCSGSCTNLDDIFNCGSCGNMCRSDQVCTDRTCTDCPVGMERCLVKYADSSAGPYVCVHPDFESRYNVCKYP